MEEALQVAADAARHNRTDDVATVLNEATIALRKASTVTGIMKEPLVVDDLEAGLSSSDDTPDTSDLSSEDSEANMAHKASADTVPTISTGDMDVKQHTAIQSPFLNSAGERPKSEQVEFDSRRPGDFYPESVLSISRFSPPQTLDGGRRKSKSIDTRSTGPAASEYDDRSLLTTPPQLASPPSADSIIIDFAYIEKKPGEGSGEAARPSIRLGLPSALRPGVAQSSVASEPVAFEPQIVRETPSASRMAPSIHELQPGDKIIAPSAQPHWEADVISTTSPPTDSSNVSRGLASRPRKRLRPHPHHFMESSYYKVPDRDDSRRHMDHDKGESAVPLTTKTSHRSHRHQQSQRMSDEYPSSRSHKYRRKPIARE